MAIFILAITPSKPSHVIMVHAHTGLLGPHGVPALSRVTGELNYVPVTVYIREPMLYILDLALELGLTINNVTRIPAPVSFTGTIIIL